MYEEEFGRVELYQHDQQAKLYCHFFIDVIIF